MLTEAGQDQTGTNLPDLREEVTQTIRVEKWPNYIVRHRINLFPTL